MNQLILTKHCLDRGLERILEYEAPYTNKQRRMMEKYIRGRFTWNSIREVWVLPDYDAELVIESNKVVTLKVTDNNYGDMREKEHDFRIYKRNNGRRRVVWGSHKPTKGTTK